MLQATDLVDRQVSTESKVGFLEVVTDQDGEAAAMLDATVSLSGNRGGMLYVQDMTGQLVYSAALPSEATGDFQIRWGGTDADGNMMPPGNYRMPVYLRVERPNGLGINIKESNRGVFQNPFRVKVWSVCNFIDARIHPLLLVRFLGATKEQPQRIQWIHNCRICKQSRQRN